MPARDYRGLAERGCNPAAVLPEPGLASLRGPEDAGDLELLVQRCPVAAGGAGAHLGTVGRESRAHCSGGQPGSGSRKITPSEALLSISCWRRSALA